MLRNHCLVIVTTALISLFTLSTVAAPAQQFNKVQKQEIEKIIHDYLVENPKIMVEVAQSLQKKKIAEMTVRAKQAAFENKDVLFNPSYNPIIGNQQSTLTMVEFLDFQCPHCKDMSNVIDELVANNPDLKIVIKVLPIFGPASELSAKAAIAAQKQGQDKYIEFHKALLDVKTRLDKNKIFAAAEKAGLDLRTLKKDIDDPKTAALVKKDFHLAQKLGIIGTPAFLFTNTKNLTGSDSIDYVPGAASKDDLQEHIKKVAS